MQEFNIRYIILMIILVVFSIIILWIQREQPIIKTNMDISKIPLNIGEWQGEAIAVDEKTKNILETEAVLMRKYVKGDDSVWLAVVFYKDSRVALHLPESCYTGQGSHIVKREMEKISIPGFKNPHANKLLLKGDKEDQVILYYFETGDMITNSYQTMRWQMMWNKLKSKSNSGALVRFSSSIKQNPDKTSKMLKECINDIGFLLSKYLL